MTRNKYTINIFEKIIKRKTRKMNQDGNKRGKIQEKAKQSDELLPISEAGKPEDVDKQALN